MRLHLVPNSHIDPVWLSDKYEGIDEVLNTFRSASKRLEEFPKLTFSASSLLFYKWVMKYDPTKLDPADPQFDTDQGTHFFKVFILPEQNYDEQFLNSQAAILNEPFTVIRGS